MRDLYRFPKKTSFVHSSGWCWSASYMDEAPKNEQAPSEKNANKIIGKRIQQINAHAYRNRLIRGR